LAHVAWPRAQPLGQSVSLKFSLETRLESKSFETLIDFLAFLGVILALVAWPRAQPLGQSVSLKFSLETRLESESFERLIDFLAFLVQKL